MKILLTGVTGAIGGAAFKALQAAGHDLTCPVRNLSKIPNPKAYPNVRFIQLDPALDDYTRFNKIAEGFPCIIHTGYLNSPNEAEMETNITRGLLDAAKAQSQRGKVNFVFTTGVLVLGNTDRLKGEDEIDSSNSIPMLAVRGTHEKLALGSSSDNLAVSVIRPGFMYGGSSVDYWFRACKKNKKIVIPKAKGRIAYVYKDDLGEMYRVLAENSARGCFIGTEGAGPSMDELVEFAKKVTGAKEVEEVENPFQYLNEYGFMVFGLSVHQLLDPKRLREEYGFRAKHNLVRDGERIIKFD